MTRKRRYTVIVLLVLAAAVGMSQVGWLLYTGGPYRGQLIEAETRQPLEGAAVLFYWRQNVYGGAGGPVKYPLNAKEVLTDEEGRFYIPWFVGVSLNPLSFVLEPSAIFYYPGYGSELAEVNPPDGEPLKDPTVIPMRKLRTREERIRVVGGLPPGDVPDEKMPNLIRLMNTERETLGLKPVHVQAGGAG
ncbi:MAG: hypothetical protein ACE5H7_05275 [Acidiferrobacterales bacterium]